jgi:hypothetical protein
MYLGFAAVLPVSPPEGLVGADLYFSFMDVVLLAVYMLWFPWLSSGTFPSYFLLLVPMITPTITALVIRHRRQEMSH